MNKIKDMSKQEKDYLIAMNQTIRDIKKEKKLSYGQISRMGKFNVGMIEKYVSKPTNMTIISTMKVINGLNVTNEYFYKKLSFKIREMAIMREMKA